MNSDQVLREHLVSLLRGGNAHIDLDGVIKLFPPELINKRLPNLPYSSWQVLEHIRIAQWDILEFCINSRHVSPKWPNGYWPSAEVTATNAMWDQTVSALRADLNSLVALVENNSTDLFAPLPHGTGQTILREALLVADHNSYHLGTLTLIARLLGAKTI